MASLIMTGSIKKVLSEEGFGFIETKEGDVFFHKSEYPGFTTAKKGELVRFAVTDTPKGKAACNVTTQSSIITRLADSFTFTRAGEPKHGKVIRRERVESQWYTDPNKAREKIKEIAKQAGCNAVLNLECKKTTIQKHYNYFGSIHNYTADICLVVEDVIVDADKANALQLAADVEINNVNEQIEKVMNDGEDEVTGISSGLLLTILSVAGFIAFMMVS